MSPYGKSIAVLNRSLIHRLAAILLLWSLYGAFLGVVILQLVQRNKAQNRIKKSEQQAKRIIKKAHQESDRIKKDKMLQAKERFIELKAEHEKVIFNREKK